jgi:CRP/FNR family transcriptional regulator
MFRLPMSRTDIGNYLGLAVETVSRVFTKMQRNGLLQVEGKEIEILDPDELCQVAQNQCPMFAAHQDH